MVRPTTVRPCCCKKAATAEESTPPDMATATRPRWVTARSGRVSNWMVAFTVTISFLPDSGKSAERGTSDGETVRCTEKTKEREQNAETQSAQRKDKMKRSGSAG